MKIILENKLKIDLANSELFNYLMRNSHNPSDINVLYEIYDGNKIYYTISHSKINYLMDSDVWFSFFKYVDKFVYAFGIGEVDKFETNEPTVILDFHVSGVTKSYGAFGEDEEGDLLLLYSNLFSENLKFLSESKTEYKMLEFHGTTGKNKYLLIGKLNDLNILEKLVIFVKNVHLNKNKSIDKQISSKNIEKKSQVVDVTSKSNRNRDLENKQDAFKTLQLLKDNLNVKFFTRKTIIKNISDKNFIKELDNKLENLINLGLLRKSGLGVYIIPSESDNFLKDNSDLIDIEVGNMSPNSLKENICEFCGSELSSDIISKNNEDKKICKNCSRKAYATHAIDELLNYIDYDVVFDKNDLIFKVDIPMKVLDYIWTLEELDLMEHVGTNKYKLKSEDIIIKFKEKYGTIKSPKKPVVKKKLDIVSKICSSCNKELSLSKFSKLTSSEDGFSEECKNCSRNSHASTAITDLLNYVEPDVAFDKNDLLEQVDNKMQFLDFIWTLQEFDIIEINEKTDKYMLKSNDMKKFQEKHGKVTLENRKEATGKKIIKKCHVCCDSLPLSKFYKSSNSEDGYSEECKKCSDKLNAAKILDKIQEYIKMGVPFTKKELSNKLDDHTQVNSYIWTLQEQDLLEHNEQSDTYQIKINDKFEDFCKNYLKKPEPDFEKDTKTSITSSKAPFIIEKREIIYISDNFEGNKVNLIMNAVIKNEELLSVMQSLSTFILSNLNKYLVFKCSENHSEVMIDLEIDKEYQEATLNLLKEENWENKMNML